MSELLPLRYPILDKNRVNYLFRLSSNDCKKELELMVTRDETVNLMHTNARLTKIKKNHPEIVDELKATLYVYKDFWAQIVVHNMIQDVLHSANKNL